jgi:hypothetical protein
MPRHSPCCCGDGALAVLQSILNKELLARISVGYTASTEPRAWLLPAALSERLISTAECTMQKSRAWGFPRKHLTTDRTAIHDRWRLSLFSFVASLDLVESTHRSR